MLRTECVEDLNGKWSKLYYARRAVEEGNDVFLLDADTEVVDIAPRFDDELIRTGKDILVANGLSGRPNSGVMMFKGGETSVAASFLQQCLELRESRVPAADFVTEDGENGHVIFMLKREPFASRVGILDTLWNCTHPSCVGDAYIRHYTYMLRGSLGHFSSTRTAQKGFM